MAKLHNKTVQAALALVISSGTVTSDVGKPLVQQGLIEVNPEDIAGNVDPARARLTQKGFDGMPKPAEAPGAASTASSFAIIDGVVLPPSKRGAGRVAGPAKYPFANLETGKSFFVPVSEAVPTPLKTLGSAVVNATNKYRVDTGKTEMVEKTKRDGKKAALDAAGNKIKEQVEVKVYTYPRKFAIRAVKKGDVLGTWTADADGVIVSRTV